MLNDEIPRHKLSFNIGNDIAVHISFKPFSEFKPMTPTPPTEHPEEIKDALRHIEQAAQPDALTDQERERRSSLAELRALGVEPYPYSFERTRFSDEAAALFDETTPDAHPTASIA